MSSFQQEVVTEECTSPFTLSKGWNVRSKGSSLAKVTKWLPLVPVGIPGKVPYKTKWNQSYQQGDSLIGIMLQYDRALNLLHVKQGSYYVA